MRINRTRAASGLAGIVGATIGSLLMAGQAIPARAAEAQACPVKIGGVLPLTGSMGQVGKNIASSAQLAIKHINEGGGIKGCPVEFALRDDQGQPNVGVDAAKYLIDVEHVSAITASVSSGVTIPRIISARRGPLPNGSPAVPTPTQPSCSRSPSPLSARGCTTRLFSSAIAWGSRSSRAI